MTAFVHKAFLCTQERDFHQRIVSICDFFEQQSGLVFYCFFVHCRKHCIHRKKTTDALVSIKSFILQFLRFRNTIGHLFSCCFFSSDHFLSFHFLYSFRPAPSSRSGTASPPPQDAASKPRTSKSGKDDAPTTKSRGNTTIGSHMSENLSQLSSESSDVSIPESSHEILRRNQIFAAAHQSLLSQQQNTPSSSTSASSSSASSSSTSVLISKLSWDDVVAADIEFIHVNSSNNVNSSSTPSSSITPTYLCLDLSNFTLEETDFIRVLSALKKIHPPAFDHEITSLKAFNNRLSRFASKELITALPASLTRLEFPRNSIRKHFKIMK